MTTLVWKPFPPAPVSCRPLGTGTIVQHLIPSLRPVKHSLHVDDNIWPASSHYPHHRNKEMCKHTRNMAMCHAGINHFWPKKPVSTAENEPSRATGLLLRFVTPCCSFLSQPAENKRWTLDSRRHMRSHNCPSQSLSIAAELGQLNKYLERLLPGTWVSSRDAAVSSKNVAFLNKQDRLLWRC